jgi:flagellar motor switch protein FliN
MTQEENMEEKSQAQELVQPAEESSGSIKDVPLNVCVELARLRITLDHLMHLNPGNMLELPIHPDQGVSLTVNGKKVGRAELIYVGETLGIRILELGS